MFARTREWTRCHVTWGNISTLLLPDALFVTKPRSAERHRDAA